MDKFIGEPNLMPLQTEPFNGDKFICNELIKLRDKFNIKYAIELGGCVGGNAKWFGENFKDVWTVEINPVFRDICLKRIKENKNVCSLLGSTVDLLEGLLDICIENGETPLIFIDSHWESYFPLFDELKIIGNSSLKPIILIHDCKVPNEPNLGFDKWNGIEISYETVKPYLDEIYGEKGYTYYYNSDKESTEIKRGVIYILPNE